MILKWKFYVKTHTKLNEKKRTWYVQVVQCILTVVHQKINRNLETLAEPVDLIHQ